MRARAPPVRMKNSPRKAEGEGGGFKAQEMQKTSLPPASWRISSFTQRVTRPAPLQMSVIIHQWFKAETPPRGTSGLASYSGYPSHICPTTTPP
ncbi:hypothetical protein MHYP_G00205640 [Metynnis hypsauchen]